MTPEEMRTELTRLLESWNSVRSEYNTLKLEELIIGRMRGMIELAYSFKIISDAEKNELNYIYFNENPED